MAPRPPTRASLGDHEVALGELARLDRLAQVGDRAVPVVAVGEHGAAVHQRAGAALAEDEAVLQRGIAVLERLVGRALAQRGAVLQVVAAATREREHGDGGNG